MNLPDATQAWWAAAALFSIAFVVGLVAQRIDRRLIGTEAIWVKPTKFAISLAVHFATLAVIEGQLSSEWRQGGLMTGIALSSTLCAILELAYIALQASRQLPSHFFVATPLYAALYGSMAFGAIVIIAAAGVVGSIAAVDGDAALALPLRIAVSIGLVGGTVLTLLTALRMGGNGSHSVGREPGRAVRMKLTGWSLTTGDLRPAHFFATHMIQAVPLLGLVATNSLAPGLAIVFVCLFAAAWTAFTLYLFGVALAGSPLPLHRHVRIWFGRPVDEPRP